MRPLALLAAVPLAVACATQHGVVTVTTRTEVAVSGGAAAAPVPQTVVLSPSTLDRLDPAALAALEPYGRWEESVAYGRVWLPYEGLVGSFVPYLTRGEWVATRDGWYWQSSYAWGQIPFHYGRWAEVGGAWAWVPGSTFSPAWVEWRGGNAWSGWAPLAPVGAASTAPFTYCNGLRLQGPGLQARAVTGPAAVSLFATTAAVARPALPPQLVDDVASLWSQRPPPAPQAPVAVDLAQRGPATTAPTALDPVPCARVTADVAATRAEAPVGGPSVGVIRDGDAGATLVLTSGLRSLQAGYSTIPARREAPTARRPGAARVLVARAPSPSAWDRSVAAPPAVVDDSAAALPSYGAWGAPRGGAAWAAGGVAAQPVLRSRGGLGPALPVLPVAAPTLAAPAAPSVIRLGGAPAAIAPAAQPAPSLGLTAR